MGTALKQGKSEATSTMVGGQGLPPTIKVLYITTRQRTGAWLAEAFAADSASEILLEEALGTVEGLARLREEVFDAVLVSHEPGELDALALIEGYRAGGAGEPIVVLGNQSEQEMAVLCYEIGADGYVCVHTTTTRNLIWVAARAIQLRRLMRDNYRLTLAEQTRLHREHDEAGRLLAQQQVLIGDVEARRGEQVCECGHGFCTHVARGIRLPEELIAHYRELLKTYVIMGSGNLASELKQLAELLVSAGISSRQTMRLHLVVLDELVHGLGSRSARHVMTRADLLVLEVMIQLAEGYRRRYRERIHPPAQRILPGFE